MFDVVVLKFQRYAWLCPSNGVMVEERLAGVVYDKDMKVSRRAGPVSSVVREEQVRGRRRK